MNDPAYDEFRELNWRRRLTEAEEAELRKYLAANPEAGQDWESEAELNRLLEQLPEAPPVASNFTARVLQAVERETAAQTRAPQRLGWGFAWRWLPRLAVACLTVWLGVVAYQQHQLKARVTMARNVAEFTEIVPASSPELLQDFDAIRRLSDPEPKADSELLALY